VSLLATKRPLWRGGRSAQYNGATFTGYKALREVDGGRYRSLFFLGRVKVLFSLSNEPSSASSCPPFYWISSEKGKIGLFFATHLKRGNPFLVGQSEIPSARCHFFTQEKRYEGEGKGEMLTREVKRQKATK